MSKLFVFFLLSSSCLVTSLQAFDEADEAPPSNAVASSQKRKIAALAPGASVNPFSEVQKLCGVEALKDWDKLSSTKKSQWEEKNKERLAKAVTVRMSVQSQQAEELWKEGAQNGCPISMFWLGRAAQNNRNEEEAFSWYVLSLWTQLLKGTPFKDIQNATLNPWKDLAAMASHMPNAHKVYFSDVQQGIPETEALLKSATRVFGRAQILGQIIINAHNTPFLFDERISAFTVGIVGLLQLNEGFTILGNFFYAEDSAIEKATYCYRLSSTQDSLTKISELILTQKINVDQYGKVFKEKDRYKVLRELLVKLNTPLTLFNLAGLIEEGRVTKDEKNSPISSDKKDEVVARLYRKSGIPEALFNLASLILEGRVEQDEENNSIPLGQKDEVAARLFRKSGTPQGLIGLALLKLQSNLGSILSFRKEALSLFLEASLQGVENAMEPYLLLKEMIEAEEFSQTISQDAPVSSQQADQLSPKKDESSRSDSEEDYEESKVSNSALTSLPSFPDNQLVTQAEPAPEETVSSEGRKRLKALKKAQKKYDKAQVRDKFKKLVSKDAVEKEEGFSFFRKGAMVIRKSDAKEHLQILWCKGVKDTFDSLPPHQAEKVLKLIDDIKRDGNRGKPEILPGGIMSRRITDGDRLVYRLEKGTLEIMACKGHYDGVVVDTKAKFEIDTKRNTCLPSLKVSKK